jgi:hypothetical protein
MRRWLSVLIALMILVLVTAAPASAAVTLRTWRTSLGTSAYYGTVALSAMSDGTGRLTLAMKHMPINWPYGLQIRAGTCASLGTVRAAPTYVRSSSTGIISVTRFLSVSQMNSIWYAARPASIAFRITSSKKTLCGNLKYVTATRIQISALSINLPVIRGATTYPKCGVAMWHPQLWQPREPRVTFIYGHARRGMFLPLLNQSKINNGAAMIGMTVKVWTSDNRLNYYRIDKVRRHVSSASGALSTTSERLWLQTSEGPNYTYPKLIVEAHRTSTVLSTYTAAHPTPHPYSC